MAINQELAGFLKEGLERGLARSELEEILLETGWPPDQVQGALATYADVAFPIPVPRPKPYLSAREAFIYLVLFSALNMSAFSLGGLLFQLVDRAFPDPAMDPTFALEASREAIRRALAADPTRRLSEVRRWLTYLTLFVAASILVGDVATVVYNILSGEITTRFLLKVLIVGGIAGAVFGYLSGDLRNEEVAK
jgi:hypothetical protein